MHGVQKDNRRQRLNLTVVSTGPGPVLECDSDQGQVTIQNPTFDPNPNSEQCLEAIHSPGSDSSDQGTHLHLELVSGQDSDLGSSPTTQGQNQTNPEEILVHSIDTVEMTWYVLLLIVTAYLRR